MPLTGRRFATNPLKDNKPLFVGDDETGGLVNDVANGNGRALFVGVLDYSASSSRVIVRDNSASMTHQNADGSLNSEIILQDVVSEIDVVLHTDFNGPTSTPHTAELRAKASSSLSSFQFTSTDSDEGSAASLSGNDTGVIDAFMDGPAPVFNIHDNLAVLNPFSTPSAPTAAESADAGVVDAGTHDVAYTWVTVAGETTPSARTNVTSDGSHQITLDFATPPVGVTGANVFMTSANDDGGTLKFVALVTDFGPGFYNINTPDVGLGAAALTANNAGGNLSVFGDVRMQDGQPLWLENSRTYGLVFEGGTYVFRNGSVGVAGGVGDTNRLILYASASGASEASIDLRQHQIILTPGGNGFSINGDLLPGNDVIAPNLPTTTDPNVGGELFTCTAAELANLLAAGAKYVLVSKA